MLIIKAAAIKTMDGSGIKEGDILIEGGKIAQIGKDIPVPPGAEVLDAAGLLAVPGLIDAHSHAGLREDSNKVEGEDVNEFPHNPVAPQTRAIDGVNPMDRAFVEAYENGVTSIVITTGSRNVIGGQAAAIKTFGNRIDNMIIRHPVAVKIALGENTKATYSAFHKTPCSRLGIAAILRETLYKAKNYLQALENAGEDTAKKPAFDLQMESLLPVMRGEIPFKVHAHRADDIFTALRIAREFGVKLTLEHCTDGHLIVDELVKEGWPAIIGPSLMARSKVELKNQTLENARILSEAGIKIALTTDAPVDPLKFLLLEAQLLVRHGLPEETAWKALTINPAEIAGIDDRVGSLTPGKDGDVVLFTANPMEKVKAVVAATVIDGKIVYRNQRQI
jgi:imidazolonepropionase-like amidohydrolase